MISGIHCNVFFSFKESFIIPCVFFLSVHLLFIASPSSFFPSVSLSLHLFRPEPASSSVTIGVTSPPTLCLYALLFAFLILHLLLRSFSFIKTLWSISNSLHHNLSYSFLKNYFWFKSFSGSLFSPQKIFIFFTPDWKQKQGKDTNLCEVLKQEIAISRKVPTVILSWVNKYMNSGTKLHKSNVKWPTKWLWSYKGNR